VNAPVTAVMLVITVMHVSYCDVLISHCVTLCLFLYRLLSMCVCVCGVVMLVHLL
jgi:hypothetical protein